MRLSLIPLVVLALLAGGCDRQSPPAGQGNASNAADIAAADVPPPSPDEAGSAAPAARVGSFDTSHKGEAAPTFAFTDPAGRQVTLADFRGRPVLVNLWATWCAPCVKEMPTIDALARREAGKLTVIALSQDLDAAKMKAFWARGGYAAIQPYHDPRLAFSTGLGATLPTTILYDASGREVWRRLGDTDWTGAEAKAALAAAGQA